MLSGRPSGRPFYFGMGAAWLRGLVRTAAGLPVTDPVEPALLSISFCSPAGGKAPQVFNDLPRDILSGEKHAPGFERANAGPPVRVA